MKKTFSLRALLIAAAAVIGFCGCLNLKPARQSARYFVLTPVSAGIAPEIAITNSPLPSIGVGVVKLPDYLFKETMAVRKGTNEVGYLLTTRWAERLGNGFQRMLAANLASQVPCGQIRFSAWRSEDVAAGVYVAIEQFDVDEKGRGVLVAWWRVLSSNGDKTLRSGEFNATRDDPPAAVNPDSAVATLSGLTAELSAEIAKGVREAALNSKSENRDPK